MRCVAVLDENNNILSAMCFDKPEFESFSPEIAMTYPIHEEGQTVIELDIPTEYAKLSAEGFFSRIQSEEKLQRLMGTE